MANQWILIAIAVISFAISAALGTVLIPYLKRVHFGQTILEIGPKWHKSKQGTPIMGGIMFIIGSITATIIGYIIYRMRYAELTDTDAQSNALRALACVMYALLFSAIGFADDYIKAVKKRNLGLNAKQKMFFQFLLSAAFLGVMYALGDTSTEIDFIFFRINLGLFYYPLMMLLMVFMTNAVNLTDGVDGLCATVTFIGMLVMTAVCGLLKMQELSYFAVAVAGGCLGFLIWNLHPAKCFMGDTGSMFLGGAFTAIGIAAHSHIPLILAGIIYIAEALSVVLQVISFKTTGKRIFKMSPIHHHFEMSGWSEYKIVIIFSLIGLGFGILGVLSVMK